MGTREKLSNAEMLRRKAHSYRERSRVIMAASLAMEDGVINTQQANELITACRLPHKLVVQCDHYPGDEYFDRAERELSKQGT